MWTITYDYICLHIWDSCLRKRVVKNQSYLCPKTLLAKCECLHNFSSECFFSHLFLIKIERIWPPREKAICPGFFFSEHSTFFVQPLCASSQVCLTAACRIGYGWRERSLTCNQWAYDVQGLWLGLGCILQLFLHGPTWPPTQPTSRLQQEASPTSWKSLKFSERCWCRSIAPPLHWCCSSVTPFQVSNHMGTACHPSNQENGGAYYDRVCPKPKSN